ncbi:MAG: helix-turn-helix transcriptional regulator [Colwellia sp.]|nr:helix-turn-helix transcriptional regulator [Colwellia sp.]
MAHPVDIHVGKRIRHQRWLTGSTQQQLAENVGIKFQQIQKYETGANRVSASRLYDIAAALAVPVKFFFDELDGADTPAPQAMDAREIRHLAAFRELDPDSKTALETISRNLTAKAARLREAA